MPSIIYKGIFYAIFCRFALSLPQIVNMLIIRSKLLHTQEILDWHVVLVQNLQHIPFPYLYVVANMPSIIQSDTVVCRFAIIPSTYCKYVYCSLKNASHTGDFGLIRYTVV